jgi:hypothetical protein
VLPELKKQIETDQWQLHRILDTHRELMEKCKNAEPTVDELAALAAILHAFYNGIENIFKRIAIALDGGTPKGEFWHSALIEQMASPRNNRPVLLSADLNESLQEYLDFRHLFRHAYTFDLHWSKMKHLVIECENILWQFEGELDAFLKKSEAGALK